MQIIKMLGSVCVICGYNYDWRALEIDHINGDGFKERKKYKSGYRGASIHQKFKAIKRNRERFQLLCANCHRIKTYEAREHLKNRDTKPTVISDEKFLL